MPVSRSAITVCVENGVAYGGDDVYSSTYKGFFRSLETYTWFCKANSRCVVAIWEEQHNRCVLKKEQVDRSPNEVYVSVLKVSSHLR